MKFHNIHDLKPLVTEILFKIWRCFFLSGLLIPIVNHDPSPVLYCMVKALHTTFCFIFSSIWFYNFYFLKYYCSYISFSLLVCCAYFGGYRKQCIGIVLFLPLHGSCWINAEIYSKLSLILCYAIRSEQLDNYNEPAYIIFGIKGVWYVAL